MEKNWIVAEYDYYNDCGIAGFGGVYGPFTQEEAESLAERLNKQGHYATKFEARELNNRCWADTKENENGK